MKKTKLLRSIINSNQLDFLMGVQDGLSAKIAQEAGFSGIWASGLCMSAALGVRDNNEATWTQILEIVEFMSDCTTIPILLDGDTGFGDFNTMRRLVAKLESRDVAGVCIEDKLFPKTNSFLQGNSQDLADIEEFVGKIKAGKDAQKDDDFVIVARTESFIAGKGLKEALTRASAYHLAGADAILVHSARNTAEEVFAFAKEWGARCPLILVPTKYYSTPTAAFKEHGVSVVIWANHLLRASIVEMQRAAQEIATRQSVCGLEDQIAPLSEVFRLQGADELAEAEVRYNPAKVSKVRVLVLAYAQGKEMGQLVSDKPKCMIKLKGKPILQHIIDAFQKVGLRRVSVVRGFCKESVDLTAVQYADLDSSCPMNDVRAIQAVLPEIDNELIICFGDVLFRTFIVRELLESSADFAIMIDTNWRQSRNRGRQAEYVVCNVQPSNASFYDESFVRFVSNSDDTSDISGEWMGFLRVSQRGVAILKGLIENWKDITQGDMTDVLNTIVDSGHSIAVYFTCGHWIDCDSAVDAIDGGRFV